jgi:hypothetical protein
VQDLALGRFVERRQGLPVRRDQFGIAGPQLLDREIAAEQATLRPEHLDRFQDHRLNIVRVAPMQEGAKAAQLDVDVRAVRQTLHAIPPSRTARVAQVLQHPGMHQDHRQPRQVRRQLGAARHLAREDLPVEHQAVLGEHGQVPAQPRVVHQVRAGGEAVERVLVPVQLHPHAPQPRGRLGLPLQHGRRTLLVEQVQVADDRMRPAAPLRHLLDPAHFVQLAALGPIRLDIDRRDHAAAGNIVEELFHRVVAADRLVGAEDAWLHRPRQPG